MRMMKNLTERDQLRERGIRVEEDDELYDEDDEEFDGEGSAEGEGNQGRGYYNDTDLSRQSSFRSSIAPADKTK